MRMWRQVQKKFVRNVGTIGDELGGPGLKCDIMDLKRLPEEITQSLSTDTQSDD